MSRQALGAFGSICLLLSVTGSLWATSSSAAGQPERLHAPVSIPLKEARPLSRSTKKASKPHDVPEEGEPAESPRARAPPWWGKLVCNQRVTKPSPTLPSKTPSTPQQPEAEKKWWRRRRRRRKPETPLREAFPLHDTVLAPLPTFMRPEDFGGPLGRLRRMGAWARDKARRKQMVHDLYRRHEEDERVYGGRSESDDDM